MYKFTNCTTKEIYAKAKERLAFSHVPNTAIGYENCRKIVKDTVYGNEWFVSANNEKDYFVNNERDNFCVYFCMDGDEITIDHAVYNGRVESSARYLKKYAAVLCLIASCIKYDGIVEYRRRSA